MTLPDSIQKDRGQPAKVRIGTFANGVFSLQETVLADVGVVQPDLIDGDSVALLGQSAVGSSGSSWLALGRVITAGAPTLRGVALSVVTDPVGNGVVEPVVWSSAAYDTDGFWDSATPTVVTIPFDGVFALTYNLVFVNTALLGVRYIELNINGANVVSHRHPAIGSDFADLGLAVELDLNAGDVIIFGAYQTSGGTLNILKAFATVRFVGTV